MSDTWIVQGELQQSVEIGRFIRKATIADVYAASHNGQPCEAHLMLASVDKDNHFSQRFAPYGQRINRLDDASIRNVIDFGECYDPTGQRRSYVVLAPRQGASGLLLADRRSSMAQLVMYATQLAQTLDRAAAAELTPHLNLNPEQIAIDDDGFVQLDSLGFGASIDSDATFEGGVGVPLPAYAAPEQITGTKIDARTDQYAFGLILYEWLTGQAAYSGTPHDLLKQQLDAPIPATAPKAHHDDTAFNRIVKVINRCCSKDIDDRFDTWDDVSRALSNQPAAEITPIPAAVPEPSVPLAAPTNGLSQRVDQLESHWEVAIDRVNREFKTIHERLENAPAAVAPTGRSQRLDLLSLLLLFSGILFGILGFRANRQPVAPSIDTTAIETQLADMQAALDVNERERTALLERVSTLEAALSTGATPADDLVQQDDGLIAQAPATAGSAAVVASVPTSAYQGPQIRLVKTDLDQLMLLTSENIVAIDGRRADAIPEFVGEQFSAYADTSNQVTWVGSQSGLIRWQNGTLTRFDANSGLLPGNEVRAIQTASDGQSIWVGTNNGIAQIDKDGSSIFHLATLSDNIPSNDVTTLAVNDTVWVGTINGAAQFSQGTWQSINDKLPHPYVTAISTDNTSTWIGTLGGISRFDGVTWRTYTQDDGLVSNEVLDLQADGAGGVWVGTASGLAHFDSSAWLTFSSINGLPDDRIEAIALDNEQPVVGYPNGFARLDENEWQFVEIEGN